MYRMERPNKLQSGFMKIIVGAVVALIVLCAIANHFGLLVNPFSRPEEVYYQSGVEKLNTLERSQMVPALQDLDKAIELNPASSKAYVQRGIVDRVQGMALESMADLNKAIELDPQNAEAYFERAANFASAGKGKESMADLNKSLEVDPNYFPALYVRGLTYQQAAQWQLAITDLNKAVAVQPKDINPFQIYGLYTTRGSALIFVGKFAEALADYDTALKALPDKPQAYRNRGYAYFLNHSIKPAVADYTKSMELDPSYNLKGMLDTFRTVQASLTDPAEKAALAGLIVKIQQ